MKRLPSEIGREISLSSEGNLKEIEEDSLRALRGMQGQLKGIHFTIFWRLKRCPFELKGHLREVPLEFKGTHLFFIWSLRENIQEVKGTPFGIEPKLTG